MKKILSVCAVLLFFALAGYAQSAEKLTELIKTQNATYGQVAYLAATYQNRVAEDASYQQAFDALQKDGLIASGVKSDETVTVANTAYLFVQATGLKGGLFYTLFPSARYAYKELKAKSVLPQTTDPAMQISGRDAIAVLNGCITLTEGAQQ